MFSFNFYLTAAQLSMIRISMAFAVLQCRVKLSSLVLNIQ